MYRSISRLISIYDIILSPITFVSLVYTAVVLMLFQHEIFEKHDADVQLWTYIIIGWWILLAMGLISSILQGFAGYKLFCATKKDRDPKDAIKSCQLWQGVAVYSIFVEVWATLAVLIGSKLYMSGAFIYISIRLMALLFVQMHIKNLKEVKTDSVNTVEPKYNFNEKAMDPNFCAVGWKKA